MDGTDIDLTQLETLLQEQNELISKSVEQLHGDAAVLLCSVWLLCGVVVGAAVGILIYKLWRT